MMSPKEHCQRCDLEYEVDVKGRVVPHPRVWAWSNGIPRLHPTETCDKSNKPSREEKQRRQDKAWGSRQKKIEAIRADASVMMDAFLAGQEHKYTGEQIADMIGLAITDYRLKNARSRVEYPWRVAFRMKQGGVRFDKCDVYCLFCGEIQLSNVTTHTREIRAALKADAQALDYIIRYFWLSVPEVRNHIVPCALACLAGMKEMAPPGTMKLPGEFCPLVSGQEEKLFLHES